MDRRCMEMAALGRPLYPGMLYDCRSDSFIPGVTLWDKKALRDNLDVLRQPKTDLKFAASDSLNEKSNLLDVSASLKASFLGGLVEVGGSAKYLHDTKSSTHQCRVTLQYSQTTKFGQLTMTELGKIIYEDVFKHQTATHVVTAVLYGAQAFMVFDHTTAESEIKQDAEGNLHAVVKKIPTISIEGQASLKMTENEKTLVENIRVTFYGDYELKENPTTYMEALQVYKKLPSLLKQSENDGVPVRVWLYPLTLLDNKAAKLVREISMSLVCETENLIEEMEEVERRCNDLGKNQIIDIFPDLLDRLHTFQDLHSYYKIAFQKALYTVLPAIRSGEKENRALGDILNIYNKSYFTANTMNKWLDDIASELKILSSYTRKLMDLTVVTSFGSLKSILFDPDVDVVVCLSFTSLKYNDTYLEELKKFLNSEEFKMMALTSTKSFTPQVTSPWFTSIDVSESMRQNLSLFTTFSKVNKNEKRMKFIVASISDPSNPGTSIRLYQKGLLTDLKFQPVSKPPLPVVVTSDGTVTLKLQKSPTGKTIQFRVEYRTTQPTDSGDNNEAWKITDTPDAQNAFTLTGLQPGNQYWVRYRAVSEVGVSEASDSVSFSFKGRLNVTVGQWNWSITSLFNEIRKKIIPSIGISRWSLSTIQSEVTNVVNNPSNPYLGTIPGGLRAGMAFYFQGVVFATGQAFEFYFISGQKVSDNYAFYFNPRINDSVVRNSRKNGSWEKEEKNSGCPISKGSAFDIFIVIKTDGYEVYVNGQRYCLFKHRMPMEKVTTLHIDGDVIMNTVGIVANWGTSTFDKELNSGISRRKMYNIQSDVKYPVCNPRNPFLGTIPGGLRPGRALFFQGVVPSDCDRFDINMHTELTMDADIVFHLNVRLDSVACNTRRNGTWEKEENTSRCPFVKGGAFDIIMVIKPEGYQVIVNGLECLMFNHRIPVDKVTALSIGNDVFMNTFNIIEVDDVNLKVTIPANI